MKKRIMPVVHCVCLSVTLSGPSIVQAQSSQGSIVGWGSQVVGVDLSSGLVAVAAGASHSLGLKADGSIVAWGDNGGGQTNVPAPNTGFVAVAAGGLYSFGLKADGSIVAWGDNSYGQTNVPAPNTGFVAIAAGWWHSLGLKGDGSIVGSGWNNDAWLCDAPSRPPLCTRPPPPLPSCTWCGGHGEHGSGVAPTEHVTLVGSGELVLYAVGP